MQDEESLLHAMGTAAVVVQVTGTNWPKPLYTLLVTGLCRFRIDKTVMEEPYLIAEVAQLDRPTEQGTCMYSNFLLIHLGMQIVWVGIQCHNRCKMKFIFSQLIDLV